MAFTLAEVLITLSILGILAAIMIPSTMHKIQDRQQITGMKRAYSMIDNALQQMYVVEGLPSTWTDWTNSAGTNSNLFASKLAKYLPVQKYCGSDYGCFQNCKNSNAINVCGGGSNISGLGTYTTLTNQKNLWGTWTDGSNVYGKMLLKNGMYLAVSIREKAVLNFLKSKNPPPYNDFNYIRIDINGKKGPNRYGHDVFFFLFNNDGIFTKNSASHACFMYDSSSNFQQGISCYAWVLKHNNMDYKYRDVSAEW